MSSSRDPRAPRQVPPPPNSKAAASYTRFIPREELQGFASWQPGALGGDDEAAAAHHPAAAPPPRDQQALLAAARQAGYQDGYRDGLVALESFKQSVARQGSAQAAALLARLDTELSDLEHRLAGAIAQVATELARQVVRSEITLRPELVAAVAQQAAAVLLPSARQIVVRVHPDDHAWVAQGIAEELAARGARVQADAAIERGGCRIDSDAGSVDAGIARRWQQAARSLGIELPWFTAQDSDPATTEGAAA